MHIGTSARCCSGSSAKSREGVVGAVDGGYAQVVRLSLASFGFHRQLFGAVIVEVPGHSCQPGLPVAAVVVL